MFEDLLRKATKRSRWVNWLITDSGMPARETRHFLNMCYSNLAHGKQSKVAKRILKGNEPNVEAIVYELVTHELLLRLNLAPQFDPFVKNKTPDIRFEVSGQEFLADVLVTHSPKKTVEQRDGFVEMRDGGDRAQKIAGRLSEKAHKYAPTGLPLVLFVFLGDHFALRIENVEEALFGVYHSVFKIAKHDLSGTVVARTGSSGLFLPNDSGLPHWKNLSAVIACQWFDTLNREARGKRLHCLVIHHWAAAPELPVTAFRGFSQIAWSQRGPDIWEWQYTTEDAVVAKLPSTGGIEFGIYTADNPW